MHLDIALSLRTNADLTSAGPTAFVGHEHINQSHSDYQCDHGLEIADCHAASSETDHNMQNDWDPGDVSHPSVSRRPSSQEPFAGAGRGLGDVTGYTELNRTMTDDPWNPSSSEADFNLACWLVQSKVAKLEINA